MVSPTKAGITSVVKNSSDVTSASGKGPGVKITSYASEASEDI